MFFKKSLATKRHFFSFQKSSFSLKYFRYDCSRIIKKSHFVHTSKIHFCLHPLISSNVIQNYSLGCCHIPWGDTLPNTRIRLSQLAGLEPNLPTFLATNRLVKQSLKPRLTDAQVIMLELLNLGLIYCIAIANRYKY